MISRRPLFFFTLSVVSFELVWSGLKKPTIMMPTWEHANLDGVIQELDATKGCKNKTYFCMCGVYELSLKRHFEPSGVVESVGSYSVYGMCCGDYLCGCCKTDPQMAKLPPTVTNTSKECDEYFHKAYSCSNEDMVCILQDNPKNDHAENICCKDRHHYTPQCRDNIPKDAQISRKFRNGRYGECHNEMQLRRPEDRPDFVQGVGLSNDCISNNSQFEIARMTSPQIVPSTSPPTDPSASTKSKAIGVAMPPSATYVIVLALVLGRFVLCLPMICGQ